MTGRKETAASSWKPYPAAAPHVVVVAVVSPGFGSQVGAPPKEGVSPWVMFGRRAPSKTKAEAQRLEPGHLVFENDLPAAVEVKLGQELKVLYPQKSHRFPSSSSEIVEVCLRDDPGISGTCRVMEGALVLCASDSFGSFGIVAADFLQKEWREVDREQALLQERKNEIEVSFEALRRRRVSYLLPMFLACLTLMFGLLFLCIFMEPEDATAISVSAAVVMLLIGLAIFASLAVASGVRLSSKFRRVLVFHGSYVCFFLGSLCAVIAVVRYITAGFWWSALIVLPPWCGISPYVVCRRFRRSLEVEMEVQHTYDCALHAERTIVFHGKVIAGSPSCVCSFPGRYKSGWQSLVASGRAGVISASVTFLPEGSAYFGRHDAIPEEEKLEGSCWCIPLYGERRRWGCHWWTEWLQNVELAVRDGAELQVYFWKGMKGKGKARDFTSVGEEYVRQQAIQDKKRDFLTSPTFYKSVDDGIEGLSKESGADSTSQYSREVQRLFWSWLPDEERQFLQESEGLGVSQKAEVAWLERKRYAYTELEVDTEAEQAELGDSPTRIDLTTSMAKPFGSFRAKKRLLGREPGGRGWWAIGGS